MLQSKGKGRGKKSDFHKVVQIAAVPKRSAFLNDSGNLFVFGAVCYFLAYIFNLLIY